MEAKELRESEFRIGNLLQDRDGRLCRVETLGGDYNVYAPAIKGGLTTLPNSPIPLTEDRLVKFGAEKIITEPKAPIWDELVEYEIKGFYFSQDISGQWFLSRIHTNIKRLEFVHQFQNLIYALSGEELVIK